MRRWLSRISVWALLFPLIVGLAIAGHRKKTDEEPKPQVLPLPKELPRALSADPRALSFRVTPLLRSGHLSSQIHDTVAGLIHDTKGTNIVKLRAFVSGAGDSRRVQEIVSEMFTDKHLSLPVLTIIQVGALGNESAAVVMEAVVVERKPVSSGGLAFIVAQTGASLPAATSNITDKLRGLTLTGADVASVTCFTATLNNYDSARASLAAAFPNAAVNVVQALRDPLDGGANCEAVARLREGMSSSAKPEGVALVTSPDIVFTGLQLSFGTYLADADSALSHLQRDIASVHADARDLVLINAFSVNPAAVSALEKTLPKFNLPRSALSVQPVEGLPSLDAALGMEAVFAPSTSSQASIVPASSASAP